ncbi:MAG: hypothetical protein KF893_01410 [Caldilineaceae bacterium]|nr:hypothetical protein [Caldilineaceae bacterium]
MTNYSFDLATPTDDPAIRRLLRENPVPGQLDLTYEREPDYFLGESILGSRCQTLVARAEESGEVVGLATRSLRPRFVNGEVEDVGYIGQLRVDEAHRGRWLLPSGFRLFHQLHADGAATGYITTIIEGNDEAKALLVEKARRHYPAYRQVDRLFTLALAVRRPKRFSTSTFEVLDGDEVELSEIVAFLQEHGRRKQFFPVYSEADFNSPTTLDFSLADFAVACQGSAILGVLGLWDQSRYKQTVVRAYGQNLLRARPLYNAGAKVLGARPLTEIGDPIHFAYASFACVAEDDPVIFNALLTRVYNRAAERGFAFVMLGLAQSDPLLAVAKKWLNIPYTSLIYTVCWPGDEDWHSRLDDRPLYVELATL